MANDEPVNRIDPASQEPKDDDVEAKKSSGIKSWLIESSKPILNGWLVALGAFITLLVTPAGAWLLTSVRELFDPTQAIVSGQVMKRGDGDPLSGAFLELQKFKGAAPLAMDRVTTGFEGEYSFFGVEEGSYRLIVHVSEGGPVAREKSFTVESGVDSKEVELLFVSPQVAQVEEGNSTELGIIGITDVVATVQRTAESTIQATGEVTGGGPLTASPAASSDESVRLSYQAQPSKTKGIYSVQVGVEGSALDVSQIAYVTYQLHESFQPSTVTRFPETGLSLSFDTWGQFRIYATVVFLDGSSITLPLDLIL